MAEEGLVAELLLREPFTPEQHDELRRIIWKAYETDIPYKILTFIREGMRRSVHWYLAHGRREKPYHYWIPTVQESELATHLLRLNVRDYVAEWQRKFAEWDYPDTYRIETFPVDTDRLGIWMSTQNMPYDLSKIRLQWYQLPRDEPTSTTPATEV